MSYYFGYNENTDIYDYEEKKINLQDIYFKNYCKYCDKITIFSFLEISPGNNIVLNVSN